MNNKLIKLFFYISSHIAVIIIAVYMMQQPYECITELLKCVFLIFLNSYLYETVTITTKIQICDPNFCSCGMSSMSIVWSFINSCCKFIWRCTLLLSHVDVVALEPTTRRFPLNRWPIGSRDSELFGCRKYTTIADSSHEMTEYAMLLFRVVNISTS